MKKLGIFLANGFEDMEAIVPYDQCKRAGIDVEFISINEDKQVTSSHNLVVLAHNTINMINFEEYDGIILPGGSKGVDNLKENIKLMTMLLEFNINNKLIGAICAAPTILLQLNIISDQKYTCYETMKKENSNYSRKPVVVSDNIITSTNCGTSSYFGIAIIEYLLGKEKSLEIKKETMYKK